MRGQPLACEVKQLNALEAAPIRAALARVGRSLATGLDQLQRAHDSVPPEPPEPEGKPADLPEGASPEERAAYDAAVEAWLKAHPDYIEALRVRTHMTRLLLTQGQEVDATSLPPEDVMRTVFHSYVRNVEGVELDGEPVTTGDALLEIADKDAIAAVVGKLRKLYELSQAEGKGSASPSTSSPEGAMGSGASGAPSTGDEALQAS